MYIRGYDISFRNAKRKVKYFFQRRIRGWDDSDTWSLDYTMAKLLVPRLKRFKELNNGYPYGLNEDLWDSTIDKMIKSFEFICSDARWIGPFPEYVEEGRNLYNKHFYDLWW